MNPNASYGNPDPIQMGIWTLQITIQSCDMNDGREFRLGAFLCDRLDNIRKMSNRLDVLQELAIGANAIISSLDGRKPWHNDALEFANLIVDGLSEYYRDNGKPPIKKARYGDSLSCELQEDNSEEYALCAIAENASTSPRKLKKLAKNSDWRVRAAVAKNSQAPKELLEKLASDNDEGVRAYAAQNPATPVKTLEKLATDSSEYVREYLSRNSSTPISLLEALANDSNWFPRSGVAENPNTPAYLLAQLAKDPDDRVRSIAINHPNFNPYA